MQFWTPNPRSVGGGTACKQKTPWGSWRRASVGAVSYLTALCLLRWLPGGIIALWQLDGDAWLHHPQCNCARTRESLCQCCCRLWMRFFNLYMRTRGLPQQ